MLDSIKSVLVPIHPEGYRFIGTFAAITLILFLFLPDFFGWIGVVLTLWCAYFFRDPERVTPIREGLIISPADGRISAIEDVTPPPELDLGEETRTRVSVFMNVFDVHVNRTPHPGKITSIVYVPGKFLNAELDKASEHNERQAMVIETARKKKIGVVQIAGLVARRIVKFVDEGDMLTAGQRFGLIRFGSRVDVYLPAGTAPLVAIGQRSIAGETVIANISSREKEREARKS